MADNALAKISNATRMLAEARTLSEVKKISDLAKAAQTYARAAELGQEAIDYATEIRFEAERKIGQMLEETPKAKGGKPYQKSTGLSDNPVEKTLKQMGFGKNASNRIRVVDSLTEAQFNEVKTGRVKLNDVVREKKRKEVREALESIKGKETKTLEGVYDVIVIDPPWPIQKIERDERPRQVGLDYPTLSLEDMGCLKIPCADNCHVWLWTTHRFLPQAFSLFAQWDLNYICTFVWHKPGGFQPVGLPQYNCEFALYARRGTPIFMDTKALPVCFSAARGKHSEKPQEFYDMVRRVTAGRRLDMFSRKAKEGFDGWGKEANG